MKKLLVLTLVLGIASLATAGIDLGTIAGMSYDVAGNTVTISSTGTVNGYLLNMEADDLSALSNSFVPAGFLQYNYAGFASGTVWHGASASSTTGVTGVVYSIDFTPGASVINFVYSSIYADNSSLSVDGSANGLAGYSMTVPEPATMALLGLGALMLRRKKA